VLIAAAHAVVRAGYRALLDSDHEIEVMPDVDDRRSVVGLVQKREVHVVLLDLGLDGLDDPEAIATIVSHPALAGAAVMLIAPADSDERVLVALRAGARGVLTHDVQPAELLAGVHLLAAGQALLPARAIRRFLHELATRSRLDGRAAERFQELTEREREIVALAATGLTNTEIAERLVISTATAKTHVSRAMIKLDARHRAQLVAIAYEAGLARPCQPDRPQHAGPASAPDATSRVVELAGPW
jgi:DNA-binding NarL/FixJ family response regulator